MGRNHGVPRRLMMMMMMMTATGLGSACSRRCYSGRFIVALSLLHPSIAAGLGWWRWRGDSSVRHEGVCFYFLVRSDILFCVNSEKEKSVILPVILQYVLSWLSVIIIIESQ